MMHRGTAAQFRVRDSRGDVARRGFTLLEVVLVTGIIATCAAIAIPRYGRAAGRHRADLAAGRVAADLRQAQVYAYVSSASRTVTFTVASSQYQIVDSTPLDGTTGTYTVNLTAPPYKAKIVSVAFKDSGPSVIFNGWGLPDSGGTVVVSVGSEQRTITLDATTGYTSIQ